MSHEGAFWKISAVPGAGQQGEWGIIVQWVQSFCVEDEEVLEMDGGNNAQQCEHI